MLLEFFIIQNLLLYYAQTNSVQKATAANMRVFARQGWTEEKSTANLYSPSVQAVACLNLIGG